MRELPFTAADPAYVADQEKKFVPAPRVADGYTIAGQHMVKDRKRFQALYAIAQWKMAIQIADDVILWSQHGRPATYLLRQWAAAIDEAAEAVEPAMEKLMRQRVEDYKKIRHWQMIESQIDVVVKQSEEFMTTGKQKQPVVSSYAGAIVNYGMREGDHAPKQSSQQLSINGGTVKIITNGSNAHSPAKRLATNRARKMLKGPKPIDAEFRPVD